MRIFRKFETLVGYLKDIGIADFRVHAADYDPAAKLASARPDSAERLRRAHEAAAYDDWFRSKVAASLHGIGDGSNDLLSEEEWQAERAAQGRVP